MLNILYLHAGAELYGADIVLLQLLKNLDKSKFNIHVILPNDGPLVDELAKSSIKVEVLNYPILRRKYFNIKGIANYAYNYFNSCKRLKKYCRENEIDIIHVNTLAVLEGIYLKRKLNIKFIWHVHEIITKPKLLNKFLSNLLAKYSDKVIVVSEAVKNHLAKNAQFKKNQIEVVYNGIDNQIFNPNNDIENLKKEFKIKDNEIVVGMIGRVNSWKGQLNFLEAMNIVFENNKNIRMLMVGGVFKGEEWRIDELKRKVEESLYKDKIIIQDYRKDTPNLHCLFDIFVLPSIQPDPLPTVVLEAMASGTPIVGYRHGGVTEMVKEGYNGMLAEACEPRELANKIEVLIKDTNLRNMMKINSYNRQIDMFSLESYVSNLSNVYNIIINVQ